MGDCLIKDWEKLKLTEEENIVFSGDFDDPNENKARLQISLILVGKMLTCSPFNTEALKKTVTSIWRLKENVSIRSMESNLFVF